MSDEYRWVKNAAAKTKFELPASWEEREPTTDLPANSHIVMSPDRKISLEYTWISQGAPEAAQDEHQLLEILKTRMSDVVVTKPAGNVIQNGLHLFGLAGKGKINDNYAEWVMLTFGNRRGQGLLLNIMGVDGFHGATRDVITHITMSVVPDEPPVPAAGN